MQIDFCYVDKPTFGRQASCLHENDKGDKYRKDRRAIEKAVNSPEFDEKFRALTGLSLTPAQKNEVVDIWRGKIARLNAEETDFDTPPEVVASRFPTILTELAIPIPRDVESLIRPLALAIALRDSVDSTKLIDVLYPNESTVPAVNVYIREYVNLVLRDSSIAGAYSVVPSLEVTGRLAQDLDSATKRRIQLLFKPENRDSFYQEIGLDIRSGDLPIS